MLTLSRALPITVAMTWFDPHLCKDWGRLTRPRGPKLDPYVFENHLSHIQNLELRACSCNARHWVRLLETPAPLLETFRLDIHLDHPCSPPGSDAAVALPFNSIASHLRLRHIALKNTSLSNWAFATYPLSQLVVFQISAPNNTTLRSVLTVPTHKQLVDCLSLMPALEELVLKHCLPYFYLNPAFCPHPAPLPHLRELTLGDHFDRCHQVFKSLNIPPTAKVQVIKSHDSALSDLDFRRILPSLSPHLTLSNPAILTGRCGGGSNSGPRTLSLTSFGYGVVLSAWRDFTPPTNAPYEFIWRYDRADVCLECKLGSGNYEMKRRVLLQACAGVPLADLRMLKVHAADVAWSAHDWYDTFVACRRITHVWAYGRAGGGKLPFALKLCTGTGDTYSAPLFPELATLWLCDFNFILMYEEWSALLEAMRQRQANSVCARMLDRIGVYRCVLTQEMVDSLYKFATVVLYNKIKDT